MVLSNHQIMAYQILGHQVNWQCIADLTVKLEFLNQLLALAILPLFIFTQTTQQQEARLLPMDSWSRGLKYKVFSVLIYLTASFQNNQQIVSFQTKSYRIVSYYIAVRPFYFLFSIKYVSRTESDIKIFIEELLDECSSSQLVHRELDLNGGDSSKIESTQDGQIQREIEYMT